MRHDSSAPRRCAYVHQDIDHRCGVYALPGHDMCHVHADVALRVIDRLAPEKVSRAAAMLANGDQLKVVGDAIGLTAGQVSALKNSRDFPRVAERPRTPVRELDLIPVAEIKGSDGRWRTMYGPSVTRGSATG